MRVVNNPEAGSYDAIVDGEVVGMVVYERKHDRVIVRHTAVLPGFRGRGIATALARGALEDMLRDGLSLTNHCGFLAGFLERNPRYARLIDPERPGRVLWWDMTAAGGRAT